MSTATPAPEPYRAKIWKNQRGELYFMIVYCPACKDKLRLLWPCSVLTAYAAARNPAVEVDKLIHFAMGVYWKASIHSWESERREPRIDLGPYREAVRRAERGPEHRGKATCYNSVSYKKPGVAELADALDSKSSGT